MLLTLPKELGVRQRRIQQSWAEFCRTGTHRTACSAILGEGSYYPRKRTCRRFLRRTGPSQQV